MRLGLGDIPQHEVIPLVKNKHRWKFFSEDITGAHRWKCKKCHLLVKLDQKTHPSFKVLPSCQESCEIVINLEIVSQIMET